MTWDVVETDTSNKRYYIDQWVILKGMVEKNKNFDMFSHNFTDTEWKKFGLKSANVDLNSYQGEVSIKWTISDIIDELPIIKVEEIVSESAKEAPAKIVADSTVVFIDTANLIVDLSPTKGFTLEETAEDIKIIDINESTPETVLSISSFNCDSSSNLTDCETLQKNLKTMNADSFISTHWIKYTNMTETNTWLAFDWNGKWFYVRPSWEKNLVNFVDLISFLNDGTLKNDIQKEVWKTCKTLDAKLWDTFTLKSTLQSDDLLLATIQWLSTDWKNNVVCKYNVKIWHTPEFQHLSTVVTINEEYIEEIDDSSDDSDSDDIEIEKSEWASVLTGDQDSVDSVDSTAVWTGDDDTNTATIIEQWEYEWRLSFSSARWYSLYFSDKWVWYAWSYLDDDDSLQIWDTSCNYWVKVTNRKNVEQVQSAPDSIIYECGWEISLDSLPAWITYITKVWNKHFLKNDLTDKYIWMEVWIIDNN